MSPEEEGRAKALRYYRILAVVLGLIGVTQLSLGIVGVTKENSYGGSTFGPPFYVGGFIVGILGLLSAGLCACVLFKADADSDVKKRELACTMHGQYAVSMFMIMGCFAGSVLAGIGGISDFGEPSEGEYYETKKTLAVVILVLCIVALGVAIASLCVVCTYGAYFGVIIQNRRGGRVVIWNNTGTSGTVTMHTTAYGMGGINSAPFNTTTYGMNTQNDEQIRNLQEQNRLLQQQLELQRQLNQQQQYSGGYYPPPPASYGNQSAPPPSYDSVK